MNKIWSQGKFDIKTENLLLKLVGLKLKEPYDKSNKCCLFRTPFINNKSLLFL
jgi:hypothetical protein